MDGKVRKNLFHWWSKYGKEEVVAKTRQSSVGEIMFCRLRGRMLLPYLADGDALVGDCKIMFLVILIVV